MFLLVFAVQEVIIELCSFNLTSESRCLVLYSSKTISPAMELKVADFGSVFAGKDETGDGEGGEWQG